MAESYQPHSNQPSVPEEGAEEGAEGGREARWGAALPRDGAAGGYKTHTPRRSHRSHRFRPLIAERDRKAELAKPGESDPETSPNVPVSAAPAIIEETRKPGDPASSTFFPSQRHAKALTLKREARGAQKERRL